MEQIKVKTSDTPSLKDLAKEKYELTTIDWVVNAIIIIVKERKVNG